MQLHPLSNQHANGTGLANGRASAAAAAATAAPAGASPTTATTTPSASVSLANWNISYTTHPAKVVIARDIAHVQEVVRDSATYPTPVTVVGSMHSVNECIVNDGGTLLVTSGMEGILGLVGGGEQRLVAVQAGCKLAKLHSWLADRDSELSFSPEIGDATVGSLVTTTSKDSSLGGLGYLSALVYDVTYVDEEGRVVRLCRETDSEALAHFTCSNGLMGIVVEATLVARPLAAIRTHLHCLLANDKLPRRLLRLKDKADNLFAIISTDGYVYVEQRFSSPWLGLSKPVFGWGWFTRLVARVKYGAFLRGRMSRALGGLVLLEPAMRLMPALHYRHEFVNSYPSVSASEERLDFTFYEFPLERFSEVVTGMLGQVKAFTTETGFKPTGMAMYFVTRPGDRPSGSFSGPPGTSFMMDPFTCDPQDARWLQFLDRLNDWAAAHGARMSPTQTKRVTGRHYALDQRYVRPRFLSPYYKQFVKQ